MDSNVKLCSLKNNPDEVAPGSREGSPRRETGDPPMISMAEGLAMRNEAVQAERHRMRGCNPLSSTRVGGGPSSSSLGADVSTIPGDGVRARQAESAEEEDDQVGLNCTSDEDNFEHSEEEDASDLDESAIIDLHSLGADKSDLSKKDNSGNNCSEASRLEIDSILSRDYDVKIVKPCLPPVSGKLAEAVTRWCRITPPREKIKQYFQDTLIPDNVDGLKPVRINEILYQKLPSRAKLNDQRL